LRKTEHFRIFAKIFAKIFVIFVYFRLKIFAKTKINFRENAKTKIFVSTLASMFAVDVGPTYTQCCQVLRGLRRQFNKKIPATRDKHTAISNVNKNPLLFRYFLRLLFHNKNKNKVINFPSILLCENVLLTNKKFRYFSAIFVLDR
jgi:hypothetical protein